MHYSGPSGEIRSIHPADLFSMAINWRTSLQTLLSQFQAKAVSSGGIYHLMVEVADDERDKMSGPPWFKPFEKPRVVNGQLKPSRWDCFRFTGLPSVAPSFREPFLGEAFGEEERVLRDLNGVVRAVPVPMKLRSSYFCGRPAEEISEYETLANLAARCLLDADDLSDHFLFGDLSDIFRRPRGGVRYIFGEVPEVPPFFTSSGWQCGVIKFENGVMIDEPVGESDPDSSNWTLLLHRIGWRRQKGCPLIAQRSSWEGNAEVAYEMLNADLAQFPESFKEQFSKYSRDSYYSVLGTKDAPIDVYLASVFAIQLLLADLATSQSISSTDTDYSKQPWSGLILPSLKTINRYEIKDAQLPQIGVVVATEIERQSVLKRLKPPKNSRSVLQVFLGNNTYFVGRLGIARIVLVMTEMGSVGRDSSAMVTAELIDQWKPDAVVMVGIAFGKDAEKQMIGQVLISERVISYEPERIGREVNQDRGEEHKAGPILLNRFRNLLGWCFRNPNGVPCAHQVGPILSGEKLVDSPTKKSELFARFPTAIGGEMEGAGFSAAAERKKREWIIVKAICDWGDGEKEKQHQGFAAAASVDLLHHLLNQVGVLDALSQHE